MEIEKELELMDVLPEGCFEFKGQGGEHVFLRTRDVVCVLRNNIKQITIIQLRTGSPPVCLTTHEGIEEIAKKIKEVEFFAKGRKIKMEAGVE